MWTSWTIGARMAPSPCRSNPFGLGANESRSNGVSKSPAVVPINNVLMPGAPPLQSDDRTAVGAQGAPAFCPLCSGAYRRGQVVASDAIESYLRTVQFAFVVPRAVQLARRRGSRGIFAAEASVSPARSVLLCRYLLRSSMRDVLAQLITNSAFDAVAIVQLAWTASRQNWAYLDSGLTSTLGLDRYVKCLSGNVYLDGDSHFSGSRSRVRRVGEVRVGTSNARDRNDQRGTAGARQVSAERVRP